MSTIFKRLASYVGKVTPDKIFGTKKAKYFEDFVEHVEKEARRVFSHQPDGKKRKGTWHVHTGGTYRARLRDGPSFIHEGRFESSVTSEELERKDDAEEAETVGSGSEKKEDSK
ncbi:MAG: hypothetical protein MMC23_002978 [Stictis urceolatum]|nr:hypothetical protein [Stictis urceolata]